jgi:hypothetical protein
MREARRVKNSRPPVPTQVDFLPCLQCANVKETDAIVYIAQGRSFALRKIIGIRLKAREDTFDGFVTRVFVFQEREFRSEAVEMFFKSQKQITGSNSYVVTVCHQKREQQKYTGEDLKCPLGKSYPR